MKRIFLACICYLLILPTGLWAKRIIKVACVGNSITYGAGISNREKNSYPAQLQYYLGDDYEVRNFGSNGATAQSDGDYPYVRTGVYGESKNFLPDIVLIKLGTKRHQAAELERRKAFYGRISNAYRYLPLAGFASAGDSAHSGALLPYREEHHQSAHYRRKGTFASRTAGLITDWVLLICIICLATSGIRSLCRTVCIHLLSVRVRWRVKSAITCAECSSK